MARNHDGHACRAGCGAVLASRARCKRCRAKGKPMLEEASRDRTIWERLGSDPERLARIAAHAERVAREEPEAQRKAAEANRARRRKTV